jgi:hypothetical protein
MSPAGCTWNVYPREGESAAQVTHRVETMKGRLQALHAKKNKVAQAPRTTPAVKAMPVEKLDTTETPRTLEQLQARYAAAKRNYLMWRGRIHTKAFDVEYTKAQKDHYRTQHQAACDKLLVARKALRKAERKHGHE